MKLWSGRFQKETNHMVDDFHSSISFDRRLFEKDIQGSMAHAKMLARQGILSAADEEKIQSGLSSILQDMREGKIDFPAPTQIGAPPPWRREAGGESRPPTRRPGVRPPAAA